MLNIINHNNARGIKIEYKRNYLQKNTGSMKYVKQCGAETTRGQSVGKLVSSRYYIDHSIKIRDLVEDLSNNESISAVGVLDAKQTITGLIIRKHLFDLLARRFGREVLENKTIGEIILSKQTASQIVYQVPVFSIERNIFSVMQDIKPQLETKEVHRFILSKNGNDFAGIFTNIDMLFYLSGITQSDLKIATSLQRRIVNDKVIMEEQFFTAFGFTKMAKDVGGDFYQINSVDHQNTLLSICDVSGKGVPAALITSILGGFFSIYDFKKGLNLFIKKLNNYIYQSFNLERFVTGVFMNFNQETGKVSIYDMGHSYLYLLRKGRLFQMKSNFNNLPLGISEEIEPKCCHITLKPGDKLVAFTDGIPEQTNPDREEYGIKNILYLLEKADIGCPDELIETITGNLKDFRKTEPQQDDLTMIALHYKGPAFLNKPHEFIVYESI